MPESEVHLALHLARRQPALAHGLAPDRGRRRVPVRQRLRLDVLHPRRQALVGGELRDAAAHHARAEHADAVHVARPHGGIGDARLLLDLLGQEEDVEQVPLDLAPEDQADVARLRRETVGDRPPVALLDHLQRFERRGIVAAGLLEHALVAPRRRWPCGRTAFPPGRGPPATSACAASAGLPPPELRARETPGPILEDRGRDRLVDEPDLLRAAGVERLAGQDEVERRGETDDARQPRASAPGREDPEADLGQADLGLLRVRHEPVVARERELGAAAEARAVDRRDRRVRQVRELLEERLHPLDVACGRPRAGRCANSLTSAPAMNTSGLPLRTSSARMRASRVSRTSTSPSSATTAVENLLTFSPGRSKVRTARPSSSTLISKAIMPATAPRRPPRPVRRRCTSSPGRTASRAAASPAGASSRAGWPTSPPGGRGRSRRR